MGILVTLLILFLLPISSAESKGCDSKSSKLHTKTYRSVPFSLRPGDVQDRFYRMEFPSGHLGVKNFKGEVVDELGIPVPLSEVYLHHWVVFQLYVPASEADTYGYDGFSMNSSTSSNVKVAGNEGICQHNVLSQIWGLGSETRHTNYQVPDPYAIAVGDRAKAPDGYEEVWVLNIHAIAITGTEDPRGCLECRCDLYNVTKNEKGKPLPHDYKGGLDCCYEGTRCKVVEGNQEAPSKKLYLQYTVEWVEWDECVSPVRAYIFDVTDTGERDATDRKVGCKIEYGVPPCDHNDVDCVYIMKNSVVIPKGGSLVYGVAHQHLGGQGMVLHGEDGRHVCSSMPTYGQGSTAGDEAGHIVGMSTCYPRVGDVSLANGETIQLTSFYNSTEEHTGVMALFYVLVTDDDSIKDHVRTRSYTPKTRGSTSFIAAAVALVVLAAAFGIFIGNKLESREFYEPI